MNEREIFSNALQKATATERSDYLGQVCGSDSPMRARIEKLLAEQSSLGSFMEHPPVQDHLTELAGDSPANPQTTADPDRTAIDPGHVRLDFLAPSKKSECLGLLGQYEILEVVGRGGMGIVLKGHDTKLNRIVAIKVLAPEIASIPTAHKRFLREAQAAAAVSHDHLVTIYAVEEQPVPHLVMEYIDGWSLQQKIDAEGQLELKEVLRIGRQIAAGLAAAHEQGLTHRDIKPSNILLQNGIQRVQITDFGLARATTDLDITRTGEVAGTPQYMSPEQAKSQPVDQRSDLFSLGSVLYAMCTGHSPFRASTPLAAIRRVCDDEPRSLRENNPEIPNWLAAIIEKLLAKNPDDRFQTAAEVAELLSKCLSHLQDPGSTPFPGTIRPLKRQPATAAQPQRPWLVAALVLIAVGMMLGATEATGVTNFSGTVVRIMTGEGTLVVEVDDPTVEVTLDGEELSISGAGLRELRLRPGQYQFRANKDGQPVKQELVTISRGDRRIVHVTREGPNDGQIVQTDPAATSEASSDGTLGEIRRLRQLEGHTGAVTNIVFFNDDRRVLTSSHDLKIRIWDVLTGELQDILPVNVKGWAEPIALAPDQRHIALEGDEVGSIMLFNMKTEDTVKQLVGHTNNVGYLEYSPNGHQLLSRGRDSSVRLWDVASGEELSRLDAGPWWASRAATFSPDGTQILYGDMEHVILWDINARSQVHKVPTYSGQIMQVAFSPDGLRFAAATLSGAVHVFNATAGELEGTIYIKAQRPFIQFSPNGKQLISSTVDKTLRIWSLSTFAETHRVTADENTLGEFAVSPDGRHIVAGVGMYFEQAQGEYVEVGDNRMTVFAAPESVWKATAPTLESN